VEDSQYLFSRKSTQQEEDGEILELKECGQGIQKRLKRCAPRELNEAGLEGSKLWEKNGGGPKEVKWGDLATIPALPLKIYATR